MVVEGVFVVGLGLKDLVQQFLGRLELAGIVGGHGLFQSGFGGFDPSLYGPQPGLDLGRVCTGCEQCDIVFFSLVQASQVPVGFGEQMDDGRVFWGVLGGHFQVFDGQGVLPVVDFCLAHGTIDPGGFGLKVPISSLDFSGLIHGI